MRDMLENCRDALANPFQATRISNVDFDSPRGRLALDYMVHKACDFKKWMDAYNYSDPKYDWKHNREEGLDQALSKKFAEEAKRKEAGLDEPDLMARCRYHLHVEKGLPCYFNK